jgi:PAS domain S-box-containing protein
MQADTYTVSRRLSVPAHEREEWLSYQMIDALPAAIYTTDAQGRLTYFNRAAVDLSGRTPDLGTDQWCVSWKLYRPDGTPLPHDQCPMAIALKEGRIVRGDVIIVERPDGERRWVEPNPAPLFDDAGNIVGGINMLVDVTERMQAEEAKAELAAIVESSEDAIVSKNLNSIIKSWNAGAERLFGYTAAEAIGNSVTMLIPQDMPNEELKILDRIRRGQRIEHYETIRRRKDGTRINVSLSVSPVKNAQGQIIGAAKIARNITQQKQTEEKLRQLAKDLSEADRRKNEFLAMLAHELRNPMAPIRNAVQILRLTGGNETIQAASETLERQVAQLVRMVDDLLDINRIVRGKIELRKETVELAPIVRQAVEVAGPSYESMEHSLTVDLPPEPVFLEADSARLTQVLANLLNNSCKFTNRGGRISVTASREVQHVVIRVADNGIGIAAEQFERIFDMFAQADTSLERSGSGLGIGLTLVKNLVEMHGGTVDVASAGIGQGSEFLIRLPISAAVEKPKPPVAPLGKSAPVTPRRILVVDDNRDSAKTMAMLLKVSGHESQIAYDGLEALTAAEKFRPEVILLDIGLPKLNGYETAEKLREQSWGKDILLIALTGWGHDEDRQKSQDAGFDAHMVKPVDYAALTKLLADVSRSQQVA